MTCVATVMKLNLQQDEWTKLPQYSARNFAMTSLANQLVLVGGCDLGLVLHIRITKYAKSALFFT